ncbi:unnamed protein product, partial [Oppiella nova]
MFQKICEFEQQILQSIAQGRHLVNETLNNKSTKPDPLTTLWSSTALVLSQYVEKRRMVYTRDGWSVMMKKLTNLEFKLEIGDEKYMPAYFGHPINKCQNWGKCGDRVDRRQKLFKIELKEVMNKMDHKSKEYKNFFINNINSGQNSETESLKDIELGFIKDMFVVMSVFFGFITLLKCETLVKVYIRRCIEVQPHLNAIIGTSYESA